MQRIQARTRDFVGALQMMQVGPGEMAASVAGAGGIQRPGVVAVARIAYLDVAEAREKPAIARIAGGHDAIEHVHAPGSAQNGRASCRERMCQYGKISGVAE